MKNVGLNSNFWLKIEILVNNRYFGQKTKFRSKNEIVVKTKFYKGNLLQGLF